MFLEPMHTQYIHTRARTPPVTPSSNETHPIPHLLSASSENTPANVQ